MKVWKRRLAWLLRDWGLVSRLNRLEPDQTESRLNGEL